MFQSIFLTRVIVTLALVSGVAMAEQPIPNPLLAIDQNRSTVVDRVVAEWGHALATSGAGLSSEQLRSMLMGLRADHLLAASLAGNLEGLRNVLANALTSTAPVAASRIQPKALGDPNDDLVYTPIVPCRILDTRSGTVPPYNSIMVGGSAFPVAANLANFAPQGGSATNCNLPASFAAIAVTLTVLNPNYDAYLAASNTSNFATLTQSIVMDFSANKGLANTAIVPVDGTVKFYLGLPALVTTNVIADAVGYFKPPSGSVQPSNIIWVAQSGGNYTSVQAAINAAAAVASVNNPYLVKIAPGVYTEQVTLKDFVDVEGSGINATTIQLSAATPTVVAGAQSEMRNIAIVNTYNASLPGANAVGQTANTANGFTILSNVIAFADGMTDNLALFVTGGTLVIGDSRVVAAVSGTQTGVEVGLWASGATSTVIVRNSNVGAFSGTTKQSAHKESGAVIKMDNTQLTGTTFGTPLCFQTYVASTFTAASCP